MLKTILAKKMTAVVLSVVPQTSSLGSGVLLTSANAVKTAVHNQQTAVRVTDLDVSPISVSTLKVSWKSEAGRSYFISCKALDSEYEYSDNIYYEFKKEGLCYVNGLREDTEYVVSVVPVANEGETIKMIPSEENEKTETVEVIEEFDYEDGWTNCFAGERASGLTAMPSYGAIYGAEADKVTDTGIMRDEYGDYCCAMGVWYGYCNDRFLVELENGIQFTVKICDSKGWADDADGDGEADGRFHWFGGENNGKCIIEFIYDDKKIPSCVAFYGNWGNWDWSGLNLTENIRSIKKINYGDTYEY